MKPVWYWIQIGCVQPLMILRRFDVHVGQPPDTVAVGVALALGVEGRVDDGTAVTVAVGLEAGRDVAVGVALGRAVGVAVGRAVGVEVGRRVRVGVRHAVGVAVRLIVGVDVRCTVGVEVGRTVRVALGRAVAVEVDRTVGLGAPE